MGCSVSNSGLMVILLLVNLFANSVLADPAAGLWEQYPISHSFQLSNFEKILVPYRSKANYIALAGIVDTQKLNSILVDQDLESVRVNASLVPDPNGFSLVTIYVLDYVDSSLGQYKEMIISTLARSTDSRHRSQLGYYCLKIKVDSDRALLMGIEFFGLDKTRAEINLKNGFNLEFDVTALDQEKEISGLCKECDLISTSLVPQTFAFISPFALRRTWYEFSNLGQVGFKTFNPQEDKFELGDSETSNFLKQIQFFPVTWIIGKNIYIVVSGGN